MKLFTLLFLLMLSLFVPANIQVHSSVISVQTSSLLANNDLTHSTHKEIILIKPTNGDADQSRLSDMRAVTTQPSPAASATASPEMAPSNTPTPSVTPGKSGPPTRTPRPTATPVTIPPPTDPNRVTMMVAFGFLTVIVVLVGVWINRKNID